MARPALGYIRTSTERQAGEDRTSPADQRAGIERLAASLGVTVAQWYQDKASGATIEKRPELRALLAYCETNRQKPSAPGYVLVLNDSRFGRFPDPEESTYWRQHLKRHGWVVRFVENDDSDNLTVRSVMRAIVSGQATQKREDVRANAKRGSRGTAALGFWATRAPYGYRRKVVYPPGRERVLAATQRKAPDEKVTLVPHDAEAMVVRELFDRYDTGAESLSSVTAWLRERAPERKWTRAAVRFTLTNPAYVGDVVSGRVPSDKDERAATPQRPESEWVTKKDAHPALVSREQFAAVQDLLARNKQWTRRVRTTWLVSGIVKCPCGKRLVAGGGGHWVGEGKDRHRAYSYRCVSKAGIAADRCSYACYVVKDSLERAVIDTLAAEIGAPAHQRRLRARLDALLEEVRSAPAVSLALVERQLADAVTTRDRLVTAVADGLLTGDEAKAKLADIRRTVARLESKREAITQDRANQRALDAERDRVAAMALDFRRLSRELAGPALREFIRPWINDAWFDPTTRVLTLDIRHTPHSSHGVLTQMPRHASQKTAPAERVTRRRVVVGGRR